MGKAFSNRFRVFLLSAVMVTLLASCAGPGEDPPHDDDMYGSAEPPVETATEPPADDSGSAGPAAEDDPEIVKAFKAYKAVLEDDEEGIMFLQSKHPKGTFSSFDVYRMEKSIAFADIDGDGIPELFYSIIDMDPEDDFVMVDKATGKVFDWNPKILAYRFKDGAAEKLYDEHAPWFRVDYASSGFASTTENGFCVAGIDSWLCSHYYEYALCPGGLELLRHLWWGKEYDSTDILLFYYYAEEEAPPRWVDGEENPEWPPWAENHSITFDEYSARLQEIADSVHEVLMLDDLTKETLTFIQSNPDLPSAAIIDAAILPVAEMAPVAMSYSEAMKWLDEMIGSA